MFTLQFFTLFMSALLLLPLLVSSHPVDLDHVPRSPTPRPAVVIRQVSGPQTPLSGSSNSTKKGVHTLQDLYDGNQKFRQNARFQAEKTEAEDPSFMFLGCVDNRLSPASIFNAPAGSVISHTNIANRYSSRDPSANAAVSYAVESLNIQHIIVLGHYGCKGVEAAITHSSKASRLVRKWVKPITDLYLTSRRREIVVLRDSRKPRRGQDEGIKSAPPASDGVVLLPLAHAISDNALKAGFRALVEENVKRGVKELRTNNIITQAYAKHIKSESNEDIDVFVHGFVYDEATGEVHDLHVSFGPPGKTIPNVPFKALAAAKNFHRDNDRPGISKGKTWDFGSG